MLTRQWTRLFISGYLLFLGSLAYGVSCNGWEIETKRDPDYEAAVKAVERENWRSAVAALEKIIARRTWDDDAHTLLGFAYRKLGNYRASLQHYYRALELNPYHRGALEYLGEAYLALGEDRRARETLKRLGLACRRVSKSPNADSWKQECPEWRELKSVIQARSAD